MILNGKLIISGIIETLTGLHIGGSKTALEIGGVDLNVIKTPNGVPFIPGSSLKGKLRGLLARETGSDDVSNDPEHLKEIFGHSDKNNPFVTRLLVRDAALDIADFQSRFSDNKMEFEYSDVKWENRINRKTGTALDPRQLERVPAGAQFRFEIVYDQYDSFGSGSSLKKHLEAIELAMKLLQDDYLGGQGSRGYGQIVFRDVAVAYKTLNNGVYEQESPITNADISTFATNLAKLHHYASRTA